MYGADRRASVANSASLRVVGRRGAGHAGSGSGGVTEVVEGADEEYELTVVTGGGGAKLSPQLKTDGPGML